MIWGEILEHYRKNLKASISLGIMLVFVFLFTFFLPNIFLASGTLFLDYSLSGIDWLGFALEALLILLALIFYSIFVTLIVFAVRKEMSPVRVHYYIREMLHKFAFKVFTFYAGLAIALSVIAFLGMHFGAYLHPLTYLAVNAFLLVVSLALIFVPQAIIIDEEEIPESIANNFEFIAKYPLAFLTVVIVSLVLVAVLPLVEFIFEPLFSSGRFIAVIIALVFVVPFIEIMKSHFYMLKFELVKSIHQTQQHAPKKTPKIRL